MGKVINMLKKICIGLLATFICCIGIYNGYCYIKEQHRPEIEFVSKQNRYYVDDKFDSLNYVLTVTDYKHNTLQKKSSVKAKVVEKTNKYTILKYTVDDGHSNTRTKRLKLFKIDKGIDTVIDINIDSSVPNKDKPKTTSFKVSKHNRDINNLFFVADNYGATSLCSYKIKPIKNDMNIVIGYKCEIK